MPRVAKCSVTSSWDALPCRGGWGGQRPPRILAVPGCRLSVLGGDEEGQRGLVWWAQLLQLPQAGSEPKPGWSLP